MRNWHGMEEGFVPPLRNWENGIKEGFVPPLWYEGGFSCSSYFSFSFPCLFYFLSFPVFSLSPASHFLRLSFIFFFLSSPPLLSPVVQGPARFRGKAWRCMECCEEEEKGNQGRNYSMRRERRRIGDNLLLFRHCSDWSRFNERRTDALFLWVSVIYVNLYNDILWHIILIFNVVWHNNSIDIFS